MHKRLTFTRRSLAGALVVAAASLPAAAQAHPAPPDPPGWQAPTTVAAPSHAANAQSSFEWGDAGIGAGAAVAVLGAGVLATGVVRRRGFHHPAVH